jgi:ribonuclease HII
MSRFLYTIGVDEVGRGPLAGATTIGAVVLKPGFRRRRFSGVRDSKQLTISQREQWFEVIKEERTFGTLDFAVASVGTETIDRRGIAEALRIALRRALARLAVDPHQSYLLLDGGLRGPAAYEQRTIIRGDETELSIMLASIAAKVIRDQKMDRLARRYPQYGFEQHKGYGTRFHREMIMRFGPCKEHRRSFLGNIDAWGK